MLVHALDSVRLSNFDGSQLPFILEEANLTVFNQKSRKTRAIWPPRPSRQPLQPLYFHEYTLLRLDKNSFTFIFNRKLNGTWSIVSSSYHIKQFIPLFFVEVDDGSKVLNVI